MAEDKKGLLIALLNKGKPTAKDTVPTKDNTDKLTVCGADLLSAIEAKDARRIGMVLQAANDLLDDEEQSESPEEEKSEGY